jgi:toxin ParE1/3/4
MAAKPPVVWSPEAQADFSAIWDYYFTVAGPSAAREMAQQIGRVAAFLQEYPYRGRAREELRLGLRSMAATPYVIFYRVRDGTAELIRILDGRRDVDEIFGGS